MRFTHFQPTANIWPSPPICHHCTPYDSHGTSLMQWTQPIRPAPYCHHLSSRPLYKSPKPNYLIHLEWFNVFFLLYPIDPSWITSNDQNIRHIFYCSSSPNEKNIYFHIITNTHTNTELYKTWTFNLSLKASTSTVRQKPL